MAFMLMTIYDFVGKRFPIPPITDFIQGVGWGMLILFGATAVSEQINLLTGNIILFIVVYILLVNGVNGALRDFENDKIHTMLRQHRFGLVWRRYQRTNVHLPMLFRFYAFSFAPLFAVRWVKRFSINNMIYQTRNLYS